MNLNSPHVHFPRLSSQIEHALNRVPFDELFKHVLHDIAQNSLTDANMFQLSLLFPTYWRRVLAYVDHIGSDACIAEYRDTDDRVLYWIRSPSRPDIVHYVTNGYCTCNDWLYSSMLGPHQPGRIRYCMHQVSVMVALAMDEATRTCLNACLESMDNAMDTQPSGSNGTFTTTSKPTPTTATTTTTVTNATSSTTTKNIANLTQASPKALQRVFRLVLNPAEWTALLLEATSQRCAFGDPNDAT